MQKLKTVGAVHTIHLQNAKYTREKQKKGEEIKMKSIMQNTGNKRNHINSFSSNNNNTCNLSNSKY